MSVAQRLRQKLLDLAIHGKLVPQCAKDEPAGELLARIRKARNAGGGRTRTSAAPLPIPEEEIPFDLPRGWVWCRLGEVCDCVSIHCLGSLFLSTVVGLVSEFTGLLGSCNIR